MDLVALCIVFVAAAYIIVTVAETGRLLLWMVMNQGQIFTAAFMREWSRGMGVVPDPAPFAPVPPLPNIVGGVDDRMAPRPAPPPAASAVENRHQSDEVVTLSDNEPDDQLSIEGQQAGRQEPQGNKRKRQRTR